MPDFFPGFLPVLAADTPVPWIAIWPYAAIVLAYLVGSIPFGYLIAMLVKKIDIREHGSGNIGATNVGRVLGAKWGILALVLDIVKALLPACLFPMLLPADSIWRPHLPVACGVAAIIGHMYPCYLYLRGGKGVASALGVVAFLSPICTAGAFAVFVLSFLIWRIVSLSSICAASAFAVSHFCLFRNQLWTAEGWSLTAFSIAIPTLIILRHRANIGRLMRGEEPRFTAGKKGEK
ncbi:MAG: Glycerol-3-phosphate acyltransferase [Planctomycetaceae bacterium]|nr:Glycerol-3-phosphate acyltransferase [Planctomycetaceae bacterium]